MKKVALVLASVTVLLLGIYCDAAHAGGYQVGVYYFPGWNSKNPYWNDLKGMPGSRSPGKAWPDREPLLGFNYAEESVKVAEQHIDWAADYGITFFAFDWYYQQGKPKFTHAIDAYLKAKNKERLKYCIMWADTPFVSTTDSIEQYDSMVDYCLDHYLRDKQYLTVDGKPVIIVFSPDMLRVFAAKFNKTTRDLLDIAREKAVKRGLKGIYFVATTPAVPVWVNKLIPEYGYDAMTAYNYRWTAFSGVFHYERQPLATNYDEMIKGHEAQWDWILANTSLPYIVPITAGWDKRAWGSNTPYDHCDSTPDAFKRMLVAAKARMDAYPDKTMKMAIIEAWNEFGEGSYIEPTKKWRFQYLQAIKDVFGK